MVNYRMATDFWSIFIIFFLIIDPLGSLPIFTSLLAGITDPKRKRFILIRECLIGLVILFIFLFFGTNILLLLGLSQQAIGIAGGIILFLIALKMIFESGDQVFGNKLEGEPFIVPMAIPFIAGPSALATAILFSSQNPNYLKISAALTLAMTVSGAIFLLGSKLIKLIGDKGLDAMQRLMGLVLTAMSVEMLIKGIKSFF